MTVTTAAHHTRPTGSDDYLAAFAQSSGATLATLDGEFQARYPSVRVARLV